MKAPFFLISFIILFLGANFIHNVPCRIFNRSEICHLTTSVLKTLNLLQQWSQFAPNPNQKDSKYGVVARCKDLSTDEKVFFDSQQQSVLEKIFHARKFKYLSQLAQPQKNQAQEYSRFLSHAKRKMNFCQDKGVLEFQLYSSTTEVLPDYTVISGDKRKLLLIKAVDVIK